MTQLSLNKRNVLFFLFVNVVIICQGDDDDALFELCRLTQKKKKEKKKKRFSRALYLLINYLRQPKFNDVIFGK